MIRDGRIRVGDVVSPKSATMVGADTPINLDGEPPSYVSRGGHKLAAALDHFEIEVTNRRCLDVGSSTGGFTDCLLQRGAAAMVSCDVGYGQLDWRLRNDPRVTVIERLNFRKADPAKLGAPFDVVVVDVSFISVCLLATPLRASMAGDGDLVVLVKPQFEAGRKAVGAGGVVRDSEARRAAVGRVADCLQDKSFEVRGVISSPITGRAGNAEYLMWLRADRSKEKV